MNYPPKQTYINQFEQENEKYDSLFVNNIEFLNRDDESLHVLNILYKFKCF